MNGNPWRALGTALLVAALPAAIILTTIRMLTFDAGFYERGYLRYQVGQTTGMTAAQLADATAQIHAYFRGGPPVLLVIRKEQGPAPLFNDREQGHLEDVRSLMDLAWRGQEASLALIALIALVFVVWLRRAGVRRIATASVVGAGLTLAIFALLGAMALFDFSALWTRFHLLSFTNDMWLLDPRTDYMIRMYPLGFWFDAVVEFALRSVTAAVGVLAIGLAVRRVFRAPDRWSPVL